MAEAIGIGETVSAAGAVAAPGIGAAIASIPAPGAGIYDVAIVSFEQGTVDATQGNMQLQHGATVEGKVLSTSLMVPSEFGHVTVAAGEAITVNAVAAGGAGSIYVAEIVATRVG